MTALELVAYGTLWAILMLLAALVLALYRQLDKAYAVGTSRGGIATGVEAPALEVLTPTDVAYYKFDDATEILAVFVSTSCDACSRLLRVLKSHFAHRNIRVFTSGPWADEFRDLVDGLSAYDLAHPFDAEHAYGLTQYPTVYLVGGGKVIGRTTDTSRGAIARLCGQRETEMPPRHSQSHEANRTLAQSTSVHHPDEAS